MGKQFLTPVVLPADPTQPLEAVTKQYVDARAGSEVEISASDPIGTSPGAELWFDTDDPSGGVVNPAFDGTPQPVGAVGAPGTSLNWARGDHVHAASVYTSFNGNPSPVAVVAAPGSSTSWARGDHVHPFAPGLLGRRLNDNGQLNVKQRSGGSVALASNGVFLADRHSVSNSGVGASVLNYSALVPFGAFPPAGRPRPGSIQYIQMTTAEAAAALSTSDYLQWAHNFEGQNLQHLNWGTPQAQPLTVSFDVYSSIATTYIAELYRIEATTRSISVLLPVPAGFTTQVVTFPGDQTTVITNDNVARLQFAVNLVGGSTFTSGGILQTSWANTVTGNRWVGISNTFNATLNAIFGLTNLQVEVGTVPTPYEVRPYTDELRACQRYFERQTTAGSGSYIAFAAGAAYVTTGAQCLLNYIPKRATPTFAIPAVGQFAVLSASSTVLPATTVNFLYIGEQRAVVQVLVASGLVAGGATLMIPNANNTAYIDIISEI